jgi:hypothetical protein
MKQFILFVLLLFSFELYAQTQDTGKADKKIFVRLYSSNDKIGKGHLLYGDDSTIEIMRKHKQLRFPVNKISFIKTRRSGGHNVLMGTAIGVGTSLALFVASAATDDKENNEAPGGTSFGLGIAGLIAPVAGVAGGSIAAAVRKRETFHVDGDVEKWKHARNKIKGHL